MKSKHLVALSLTFYIYIKKVLVFLLEVPQPLASFLRVGGGGYTSLWEGAGCA